MLFCLALVAPAGEPQADPLDQAPQSSLPTVKFFYYDAAGIEWAVSAEPERLERHLAANSDSQSLLQAISSAVAETPDVAGSARQMTRWITGERERFEQSRREAPRMRMAEGIIAYLRDHDFSVSKLVDDLKHRSGASDVELVVIHLRDRQGTPSFKLKVVLVEPKIEVGKQGFNVDLPGPKASYTVVAYALGVALYEVQEIIHGPSPDDGPQPAETIEPLPVPDTTTPAPPQAVPAALQTPASN
jgi:hypothetical protein